jgi:hypothetical protein
MYVCDTQVLVITATIIEGETRVVIEFQMPGYNQANIGWIKKETGVDITRRLQVGDECQLKLFPSGGQTGCYLFDNYFCPVRIDPRQVA